MSDKESVKDQFVQGLHPSASQLNTIMWIGIDACIILVLWHLPYLKEILWPFKILCVALHEFSHAIMGVMTGARIKAITLDPNEGGLTTMQGGNPYLTLPAGYVGSAFFGALMVFAGFNVLASKIVASIVGVALLLTLFWAKNWLARGITLLFIGLIGLLWWLQGGVYLRFACLFLGVMSCFYSLWDIVDDLIARKVNESDASQFSRICGNGCLPPQFWGVFWFLLSLMFCGIAIIAALLVFKEPSQ